MVKRVHSNEVREAAFIKLKERGVDLKDIAEIVLILQQPYTPDLTLETCLESVKAVLEKREMQHALLVGIQLDELAEKGLLFEPLQSIIMSDEGLFGVDETIAIGASFGYGSIAVSTFGYLDKKKIGIVKELDRKSDDNKCHTFLDDIVCAIAANASSRVAHQYRDKEEQRDIKASASGEAHPQD